MTVYEEDEECDHAEEVEGKESHRCPICQRDTNATDVLHPVMISFDADHGLLLFFHDACYRKASSTEVNTSIRTAKLDMLLLMTEKIHDC